MQGEPGLTKRAALTLLKFIQAAGAAEGPHRGRLPAAASLHPRRPRPPSRWALHGAGSGERSSEGRRAEEAAAGARGSWRRVARSTRPPRAWSLNPVGAARAEPASPPPPPEPAPPQPCDPASSGARGVGRASRGHVTSARENPSEGAASCSSRLRGAAAIQSKGALEKPGHVGNGVARSLTEIPGITTETRSPSNPVSVAEASVSGHLQSYLATSWEDGNRRGPRDFSSFRHFCYRTAASGDICLCPDR